MKFEWRTQDTPADLCRGIIFIVPSPKFKKNKCGKYTLVAVILRQETF